MEEENKRQEEKVHNAQVKYGAGKRNKGGSAYNIVSLGYEHSQEGEILKKRDEDAHYRHLMRSKNVDTRANCGYNLVTGELRQGINLPPPSANYSGMASAGANIISQRSAS